MTWGERWEDPHVDSLPFCLVPLGLIQTLLLSFSFPSLALRVNGEEPCFPSLYKICRWRPTVLPFLLTFQSSTARLNHFVSLLRQLCRMSSWPNDEISMRKTHQNSTLESLHNDCCHGGRSKMVRHAASINIRLVEFIKSPHVLISLNLLISAVN